MIQQFLTSIVVAFLLLSSGYANGINKQKLTFVCSSENDLFIAATNSFGELNRSNSLSKSLQDAEIGSGILVLADAYPEQRVNITDEDYALAKEKSIRLYLEYPEIIPGYSTGVVQKTKWERGVIASDAFDESLEKMRIVAIHNCHYIPVKAKKPHIVVARVAGFDRAEYGLKKTDAHPILFQHKKKDILISTTKLSGFIRGRYAPTDAWISIWKMVFEWLQPDETFASLQWTPHVEPSYKISETLPTNFLDEAINRGTDWYFNSRMLMDESWSHMWDEAADYHDRVGSGPSLDLPSGNGKLGILEGFSSSIDISGNQPIRWYQRADCSSEGAMAIAMQGLLTNDKKMKEVAANVQDFLYFNSNLQGGPRADVNNPSYGLIGWDTREAGAVVHYGDDNARVILGSLMASSILQSEQWDEEIIKCILGNFRTTGPLGFRRARIEKKHLDEHGWKHFLNNEVTHFAPHYQSWIWACYLWLYNKTQYEPLLSKTKEGIRNMMQAYPHEWRWTNGLQQERARMLLPLAWLVRIEDTKEHREWLWEIANDLLLFQDECGAIREELGSEGHGSYGPPGSNKAYGTSEAPLIQENGDKLSDLLYTSNFALFSITEAAYALNDEKLKGAAKKLAEFFIRIQVQSEAHPEFDGVWYRAFDYNRWEYWASNADHGWGAWSTESGWTQGWIVTMLGMQKLETSFWDMTEEKKVDKAFEKVKGEMLPKKLFGE